MYRRCLQSFLMELEGNITEWHFAAQNGTCVEFGIHEYFSAAAVDQGVSLLHEQRRWRNNFGAREMCCVGEERYHDALETNLYYSVQMRLCMLNAGGSPCQVFENSSLMRLDPHFIIFSTPVDA